jgi:flagellar biosynthesis/type III secretory pathway protein FliH
LPNILRLLSELADDKTTLEYLEVSLRYLSAAAKDLTVENINAVIDQAFKDDGGTIMGGFVEKWIEQGKEQGKEQGLQEGQQQGFRNSILDLLLLRFDSAPPSVSARLTQINDIEVLRQLHREAATADSITAFEGYLETLK